MKIGEVAALAGVPVATVRYYERRGLIADAERTPSGYRQYGVEAARRLRFIKHAQALGFSLKDIQQMLALRSDDPAACDRVEAITSEKVRAVRQRVAELQRFERMLQDLIRACSRHEQTEPCPVLGVLNNDTQRAGSRAKAHA